MPIDDMEPLLHRFDVGSVARQSVGTGRDVDPQIVATAGQPTDMGDAG
ncbi:MAG TPA: hypothetical protein VK552_24450 [Reyranella sp.]|nr:hypothetical protein [Reyranella sp.]